MTHGRLVIFCLNFIFLLKIEKEIKSKGFFNSLHVQLIFNELCKVCLEYRNVNDCFICPIPKILFCSFSYNMIIVLSFFMSFLSRRSW